MKENNCNNCLHYVQHYIKSDLRFSRTNCGHCIRKRIKRHPIPCEHWGNGIIKEKERNKTIKETLKMMSVHLHEITQILKDD